MESTESPLTNFEEMTEYLAGRDAATEFLTPSSSCDEESKEDDSPPFRVLSVNIFSMYSATWAHSPAVKKYLMSIGITEPGMDNYEALRDLLDEHMREVEIRAFHFKLGFYRKLLETYKYPVLTLQEIPYVRTNDAPLRKLFLHMLTSMGYIYQYNGRGTVVAVLQSVYKVVFKTDVVYSDKVSVPVIYAIHLDTDKLHCLASNHFPFNLAKDSKMRKKLFYMLYNKHKEDDIAIVLCGSDPEFFWTSGDFNSAPPPGELPGISIAPEGVTGAPLLTTLEAIDRAQMHGPVATTTRASVKVLIPIVKLPGLVLRDEYPDDLLAFDGTEEDKVKKLCYTLMEINDRMPNKSDHSCLVFDMPLVKSSLINYNHLNIYQHTR